ncbi:MAG: glycosyltransferase family 2 protein [Alphaproteobacteria bacterium]|nr:glycosyltransferase family 2 protein [Alphaproteobacteria bacterium]
MSAPDLSVILPFHNEGGSVRTLFQRLFPVLGRLGLSYEIICVDDGSTDNTYSLLSHAREHDLRIKIVRLARNFGKEAALTCGLHRAKGRAAIMLDSDLQHPPEVIPELVAAWDRGAKMVYAIRRNRDTDYPLRKFLSKAFYYVFRHIAEIRMPEGAGDYRLLDRAVIDAVNALPERTRFMKGLMTWVGFDYAQVPFDVAPRPEGHTTWNLFRLVRFAFDGLASFSTLPLRIWTWFGSIISLFALAYGLLLVLRTLLFGVDVPGFASLMAGILFMGGVQLLSLGVIGEYLARVFMEVKARPIYLVAEQQGFEDAKAPRV